jgi:hypothetical protein
VNRFPQPLQVRATAGTAGSGGIVEVRGAAYRRPGRGPRPPAGQPVYLSGVAPACQSGSRGARPYQEEPELSDDSSGSEELELELEGIRGSLELLLDGINGSLELELDGRSGSEELELLGMSGSLDELLDGIRGSLELLLDGIRGSLKLLEEGISGSLELELLGMSGVLLELLELLRLRPRSHSRILSHVMSRFMVPLLILSSRCTRATRHCTNGGGMRHINRDVTCDPGRRVLTAGRAGRKVPPRWHPWTPTQENTS